MEEENAVGLVGSIQSPPEVISERFTMRPISMVFNHVHLCKHRGTTVSLSLTRVGVFQTSLRK